MAWCAGSQTVVGSVGAKLKFVTEFMVTALLLHGTSPSVYKNRSLYMACRTAVFIADMKGKNTLTGHFKGYMSLDKTVFF